MTLETKRLILRPWQETDAEALYKYANSPEVGPIAGWPVHTSIENSLDIIRTVLSVPETYAVVHKDDGHAIGSIGLMIGQASNIDIPDTEAEVGYWIGVPYWGQELIPEAVKKMLHHAFVDLQLEKVWCGYYEGNVKSRRVQEKCGFVYQYTKENVPCPLVNDVRTEHITCLTKERWFSNNIRQAENEDLARIAEIEVFNYRLNFYPIFKNDLYYFDELQVSKQIEKYKSSIESIWVYDDGVVKGFIRVENQEIKKLFVEPILQGQSIGARLLEYAISKMNANHLWALEKNVRAIAFYERHGFNVTSVKKLEDDTTEYLVRMER